MVISFIAPLFGATAPAHATAAAGDVEAGVVAHLVIDELVHIAAASRDATIPLTRSNAPMLFSCLASAGAAELVVQLTLQDPSRDGCGIIDDIRGLNFVRLCPTSLTFYLPILKAHAPSPAVITAKVAALMKCHDAVIAAHGPDLKTALLYGLQSALYQYSSHLPCCPTVRFTLRDSAHDLTTAPADRREYIGYVNDKLRIAQRIYEASPSSTPADCKPKFLRICYIASLWQAVTSPAPSAALIFARIEGPVTVDQVIAHALEELSRYGREGEGRLRVEVAVSAPTSPPGARQSSAVLPLPDTAAAAGSSEDRGAF